MNRFLAFFTTFLSLLALTRLRGRALLYLTSFKMLGAALTPLLAVIGGGTALVGAWRRDRLAILGGVLGAGLALCHVRRVTAPHRAFEQNLGPDWAASIAPDLRVRWRSSRLGASRRTARSVDYEPDVVFGIHPETHSPLLADLWQPEAGAPRSGLAVVYLHNSGWHYLNKDFLTRPFFRDLVDQGHVVLDVAYTLAPQTRLPGMLADVRQAIVWLKANATRYQIDPQRIVLMGASAGAHLALLVAYTADNPVFAVDNVTEGVNSTVCGVISYYGVGDLLAAHRGFQRIPTGGVMIERLMIHAGMLAPGKHIVGPPDFVPSLLGVAPEQIAEVCPSGSPLYYVNEHCPPTLLLHGAHDFGIDPAQSRQLYDALRKCRVPAVYVELPCSDHAFDLFFPQWAPAFHAATYDVERFLTWLAK
jgi:acetyl esterase/lipase